MNDKGEKMTKAARTVAQRGWDLRRRGEEVGHITTRKGLKWIVVQKMELSLYHKGDLDSQRSVARLHRGAFVCLAVIHGSLQYWQSV